MQADTVRVQRAGPGADPGPPAVVVGEAPPAASVWLLQWGDTLVIRCRVPDSTRTWNDEVVVSLDVDGDAAATPQHDDFQWELRRVLDSSVVYRGRNGRWEPPRADPDWRLGPEHAGGGWSAVVLEGEGEWTMVLRLEGPWLESGAAHATRRPRLAVRVRDSESSRWAAWPVVGAVHPSAVEGSPRWWGVVVGDP